jgi:CheY-like chemotaxis protein
VLILIAEDESQKLAHLREFVRRTMPEAELQVARSVRSAIKAVMESSPDLILLDMSLPTFDVAPGEPGGRPQGFGGIEVMRYMEFRQTFAKTIVVTQFEGFEERGRSYDLCSLAKALEEEHPDMFCGIVYYSALNSEWQPKLTNLIKDAEIGS